jgi:1,4-dihydroxy-6-naphthoate synthase
MGLGYGPILVSKKEFEPRDLKNFLVGVPGTLTSAFLILKIFEPEVKYKVIQFDKIIEAVINDEVDAGLLIHEGQLTYSNSGLKKIIDFGNWWQRETGLPLPLGGNVVKKELGVELARKISNLLRESVRYAMENRDEALRYALKFARGMDEKLADKFVGMYVNELTLDCGEVGKKAIQLFLDLGYEKGLIPKKIEIELLNT